jgi:hypothetical protein
MSGRHSRFPAVNRDVSAAAGTPTPKPVSAPRPEPVAEPVAELAPTPEPADAGDGYPEGGATAEVLEWVGDDEGRSAFALAAELEREKPRKGILEALGDG